MVCSLFNLLPREVIKVHSVLVDCCKTNEVKSRLVLKHNDTHYRSRINDDYMCICVIIDIIAKNQSPFTNNETTVHTVRRGTTPRHYKCLRQRYL